MRNGGVSFLVLRVIDPAESREVFVKLAEIAGDASSAQQPVAIQTKPLRKTRNPPSIKETCFE